MDNPALELDEVDIQISETNGTGNEQYTNSEALEPKREKILQYEINDKPPWYLTFFLGFQHYLTMAGSTVSVPFVLTPLMCMADDDPDKANIISTIIFVSGMVTLLQSTLGTRLPIIQGGSFSFLIPSIAILSLPQFQCPDPETFEGMTDAERTELWQVRMREIQGAIIVSAVFEVFVGVTGLIGLILRFITPMTVAPAIAMVGLSLFKVSADHASTNWAIAIATIVMIILFTQYLRKVHMPFPKFGRGTEKRRWGSYPVFEVFPVLLTIALMWILCLILTVTNAFPPGNPARTDVKLSIINDSPWFRIPYPFQWGIPTVTVGSVFGMLSGVIAGTIESIGDYYACARISGAPSPPVHAINRGIFIEGIGCILAGLWGTGNGTTSYSENIGAISVTKVGSRRVIQAAGFLMLFCALVGKVGAVLISIPEPIVGGVFCVVFATVTGVGLSNLQGADLNSPRNIFVIGFSLFFGLTISQWMEANPTSIQTGSTEVDQIIVILLRTGMFVSGFLGFVLDNTIPGTDSERGLITWNSHFGGKDKLDADPTGATGRIKDRFYDLPFGMNFVHRVKCFKRFPICPTFGVKPRPTSRKSEGQGQV